MILLAAMSLDAALLLGIGLLCLVMLSVALYQSWHYRRHAVRVLTRDDRIRQRELREAEAALAAVLDQIRDTIDRSADDMERRTTQVDHLLKLADARISELETKLNELADDAIPIDPLDRSGRGEPVLAESRSVSHELTRPHDESNGHQAGWRRHPGSIEHDLGGQVLLQRSMNSAEIPLGPLSGNGAPVVIDLDLTYFEEAHPLDAEIEAALATAFELNGEGRMPDHGPESPQTDEEAADAYGRACEMLERGYSVEDTARRLRLPIEDVRLVIELKDCVADLRPAVPFDFEDQDQDLSERSRLTTVRRL